LKTAVLCAIEKGWGKWRYREQAMPSAGNYHREIMAGRTASLDKPVPCGLHDVLIVLC